MPTKTTTETGHPKPVTFYRPGRSLNSVLLFTLWLRRVPAILRRLDA